jgi:glutathione S-transferase
MKSIHDSHVLKRLERSDAVGHEVTTAGAIRMIKLYGSHGTVSLVTHIALEELGLEYEFVALSIKDGEHLAPAYRAVHSLARVPALELSSGEVLTETPALLAYLAELAPEAGLMPSDRLGRARAAEWMSLLSSAVHVAFISFYRPTRFMDDVDAGETLRRDGKVRFFELLRHVEQKLPDAGFLLGESYTLCDAYVTVFYLWARWFELPVSELPRYTRLAQAVLSRPAVARTLVQEGLKAA